MEKVFIYREGNPYMNQISLEGKRIILKYGEEKIWGEIIKKNIPEEAKKSCEVYTDMTVSKLVCEVLNVWPKLVYNEIGKYGNRKEFYKLLMFEASKCDDPIIILDNIADHFGGFAEEAEFILTEEEKALPLAERWEIKKGYESAFRWEIGEGIKDVAQEKGLTCKNILEVNWDEFGVVILDHHAVWKIPGTTKKQIKLGCPCCLASQSMVEGFKKDQPHLTFLKGGE